MQGPRTNLHVVIPAGGSGQRLWPLSRAATPKFLHPLSPDGRTLLAATMARVSTLAGPARTFVITGAAHAVAVARQCPDLLADNIVIEPTPRDSCAAMGLAAAIIARRDPEAVMACFAADHLIDDTAAFVEVIRAAADQAQTGSLVTVGITPTRAETGYGYLRCGERIGTGPARTVLAFTEKPDTQIAHEYARSGSHLWNAGMFVWQPATFLDVLADLQPRMHDGLVRIARAWDTDDRHEVMGEIWPTLPKISVDYAVMESAAERGLVSTIPGDFGWNDVGDFDTVGTVWAHDDRKNVTIRCDAPAAPATLSHDCAGVVTVTQTARLIALLGVNDLVIVDTPDVLLVCARSRAQEVRELVRALAERADTIHL